MAGSITGAAGQPALTPSAIKATNPDNYLTSGEFTWLQQYLPDTYEKEFERYGNRSINAFLRMVGAELPTNSDLIKWEEQGRLHTKYEGVALGSYLGTEDVQTLTITGNNLRIGQTIVISDETAGSSLSNKAIITAVATNSVDVAYYEASQAAYAAASTMTVFVYGSEFNKGANGMSGSLEAEPNVFQNKPIIIKDKYIVSGSDMAQIGWVEVTSENGASGYLWYIKSEHETRQRFDDYLEMAMIEGVPAAGGSGVANLAADGQLGNQGTDGMFYTIENEGNVWSGGNPTALADFDAIIQRLDKQGAIQENVLFVNRQMGFDIDDMLAAQNSYGAGGTSYGLFDNDEEMALNLGFSGFKRGYEFYKSDWKYLNDATLRGGLVGGAVNGVLVPAGTMNVYDQVMGKNARRPFLHVRFRASETEDRRYKTWVTGSAGGASTDDFDGMRVNFLSERALCTMGANNFFIFKS
ncbi:MAG: putative structural protein [Prokaryotic dsDNA virus sp.]|nr:MAG: putative structural protein [Prokaryotic dsDNA virus sp.]|tara:strand:+ start:12117 stop:13520 length:1404 start_codon:yes stop_codon:yes gene_type:complete